MYNLCKSYSHKHMLRSKWCIFDTNFLERRKKVEIDREKKIECLCNNVRIDANHRVFRSSILFSSSSSHRSAYFTSVKRNRPETSWPIRKSMRVTFIHKSTSLSFSLSCVYKSVRVFSIELPMFWIFRTKSTECEEIAVKPNRHTLVRAYVCL